MEGGSMVKKVTDNEPSSNLLKVIDLQNKEIDNLLTKIEGLEKELIRKKRELTLHSNSEEVKAIVDENQELRQKVLTLEEYIEVLKQKTQFTEKSSKKKLSDKDMLTHFEEDNWTAYKIGKKYGISQSTVINRLKKMGKWEPKEVGNQFKKKKTDV